MATAYDEELLLHPYICERCLRDVPLTLKAYRERMKTDRRLLCEECREKRLTRAAKRRAETPREQHGGRGGA